MGKLKIGTRSVQFFARGRRFDRPRPLTHQSINRSKLDSALALELHEIGSSRHIFLILLAGSSRLSSKPRQPVLMRQTSQASISGKDRVLELLRLNHERGFQSFLFGDSS